MCSDHGWFVVRRGRGGSLIAFVLLFRHLLHRAQYESSGHGNSSGRMQFDDDRLVGQSASNDRP